MSTKIKRVFVILVAFIMIFTLAGCGGSNSGGDEPQQAEEKIIVYGVDNACNRQTKKYSTVS